MGSVFLCFLAKNLRMSEKSSTFAAQNVTAGTDSVKKREGVLAHLARALGSGS